jgi:hypothetical protein
MQMDSNSFSGTVKPPSDRTAWAARAVELADWALLWVNRTDVWGGYYRTDGGKTVNRTTRPKVSERGKVLLGEKHLRRHFRGERTEELVGLHSTGLENTSRWGAVEYDRHSDADPPPEVIQAAALILYARLEALGLHPLLYSSDGMGGLHLRTLFTRAVPTPLLYAWLQGLVNDYASLGLFARPETFPKQPQVTQEAPCGNWLRLPGRHHTRPHWSRVWDGRSWLSGAAAVAQLLTYRGDAPARIPELCGDNPAKLAGHSREWTDADWAWLESVWNRPPTKQDVINRAVGYLKRCPPAVSGQYGHDQSYRVIRAIVWGFDLGAELGFQILKEHYNPKCVPPWSDKDLMYKCRHADVKPYRKPRGYLLLEDQLRNPLGSPFRQGILRKGDRDYVSFEVRL